MTRRPELSTVLSRRLTAPLVKSCSVSYLSIVTYYVLYLKEYTGQEFIDTVTIGGLSVVNQSIGGVELEVGFDGIDGILGYGYPINACIVLLTSIDPLIKSWSNKYDVR